MRNSRGLLFDDSLKATTYSATNTVSFTTDGSVLANIQLPAGRIRVGVFQANVQASAENVYPRIAIGTERRSALSQASFGLRYSGEQTSIAVPFCVTDSSLSLIRAWGWNTDSATAFESRTAWVIAL